MPALEIEVESPQRPFGSEDLEWKARPLGNAQLLNIILIKN